jgi:DNA replication ATP-dependent helicase Dna2
MPGLHARRVSPSDLARFFFHDCERFLRFRTATPDERRAHGLPEAEFDSTPLMRAVTESGFAWEEQVVRLLSGRVVIAPGTGPLRQRRHSLAQTIAHLKAAQPGQFIYQGTLRATPLFYARYGLQPAKMSIPDNHPDLISVLAGAEGQRIFRVIDVKRGDSLQLAHRVQVLLYAIELDALLESEGIDHAAVDLTCGAVWLGGHDAPETFDIAPLRPQLERFLRDSLVPLLDNTPESASWHLHYRCEWCDYLNHCRGEMAATDDLSRLSGLTGFGKQHLQQLGVRSVSDLGRFLQAPGADDALSGSASLAGRKHYLANKVEAFRVNAPVAQGKSSRSTIPGTDRRGDS